MRPAILILVLASFVLAACGTQGTNTNWPGLSTDGQNLYVAYGPGINAYDLETQREIWSFPDEASSALQFYAAPSVQDDRVIFGDYGASGGAFNPKITVSLYALTDIMSSAPRDIWKDSELASGSIVASPLQVGDRVFIGTADNFVFALDAVTGNPIWPAPFEADHSIWGKLAYKDGVLFVNSLDKTTYALDAESGTEIWRTVMSGALAGAPIVNLDLLFVTSFDHKLHALDIATGEEQWSVMAEDWIWSSPAYEDGAVYFADAKGNVYAVDGETGDVNWTRSLDKPIRSGPVVSGDIVYIGAGAAHDSELEQGFLTALSISDGEELWQQTTPASIYSTPVVANDVIIIAMQNNAPWLMAFDLNTGARAWQIEPPQE